MNRVLRTGILKDQRSIGKKEDELARQKVPLDTQSTNAIAQLARFMGLTPQSPLEHISHIVADVVQGWHLAVIRRDEQQWSELA